MGVACNCRRANCSRVKHTCYSFAFIQMHVIVSSDKQMCALCNVLRIIRQGECRRTTFINLRNGMQWNENCAAKTTSYENIEWNKNTHTNLLSAICKNWPQRQSFDMLAFGHTFRVRLAFGVCCCHTVQWLTVDHWSIINVHLLIAVDYHKIL